MSLLNLKPKMLLKFSLMIFTTASIILVEEKEEQKIKDSLVEKKTANECDADSIAANIIRRHRQPVLLF